jgi:hypothetical protein
MSWKVDSVVSAKVWKIFTNITTGSPIVTTALAAAVDAYILAWKKSFPDLDTYTYSLLVARKGTADTFYYLECKEGIGLSFFAKDIKTAARNPFLLSITHTNPSSAVSFTSSDNYGVYNGIDATGSPISSTQTYPSIDAMKTVLEGLGYTAVLKKNTGVVNVPSNLIVNNSQSMPLKYTAIESASQLINAVLNRQSLQEVLAIDRTGLSVTYYNTIYMLAYMVASKNYPKFVT